MTRLHRGIGPLVIAGAALGLLAGCRSALPWTVSKEATPDPFVEASTFEVVPPTFDGFADLLRSRARSQEERAALTAAFNDGYVSIERPYLAPAGPTPAYTVKIVVARLERGTLSTTRFVAEVEIFDREGRVVDRLAVHVDGRDVLPEQENEKKLDLRGLTQADDVQRATERHTARMLGVYTAMYLVCRERNHDPGACTTPP